MEMIDCSILNHLHWNWAFSFFVGSEFWCAIISVFWCSSLCSVWLEVVNVSGYLFNERKKVWQHKFARILFSFLDGGHRFALIILYSFMFTVRNKTPQNQVKLKTTLQTIAVKISTHKVCWVYLPPNMNLKRAIRNPCIISIEQSNISIETQVFNSDILLSISIQLHPLSKLFPFLITRLKVSADNLHWSKFISLSNKQKY